MVGVNVSSGATLASGVSGSIATADQSSVAVSGNLAPGDLGSAGTLTLALGRGGALNFNTGSTLNFDLGPTSSASDLVSFSSAGNWLTGSGNVTLALNGIGTGIDYGQTYTIFQNVSTSSFTFANITGYDTADYQASVTQSENDYQLSFAAVVPEPSSLVSLCGAFGLLGVLRRRKRG